MRQEYSGMLKGSTKGHGYPELPSIPGVHKIVDVIDAGHPIHRNAVSLDDGYSSRRSNRGVSR
jgi:hypothetical protein